MKETNKIPKLSEKAIALYKQYNSLISQAKLEKLENDEALTKILEKYKFKVDFSEADEQFKEELSTLSPEEIADIRSHVILTPDDEYLYICMSKEDLASLKEASIEAGITNEDGTSVYLNTEFRSRQVVNSLVTQVLEELGREDVFAEGKGSWELHNKAKKLVLELCELYCKRYLI